MEDQNHYFKGIIPPPVIFFVSILISFIIQKLVPTNLVFYNWSTRVILVIPIFIISGLMAADSLLMMKRYKTAVTYNKPATRFISERSFRFTRNPLYLSLLLLFVTVVIISNSVWYFIALILLFLFFNIVVVPREENYLEKCFGKDYIQYKKRVRRWI